VADIKRDSIRTIYRDSAELDIDELERAFKELEADARAWLADQRSHTEASMIVRSADMRYKGQSFDITVPLPATPSTSMASVRAPFHEAYQRIYGIADEQAPVEIINLRVTVIGVTAKPRQAAAPDGDGGRLPLGSRPVREGGRELTAAVYQRARLRAGDSFSGPSIIDASDTTVYVPTGYTGRVDEWRNLLVERGRA
jgi:N-methylhydantoinase A